MLSKTHHYSADVLWYRSQESAGSTKHSVVFPAKKEIHVSAPSQFNGDASQIHPEELFVSSIASCHMLTYLWLCDKNHLDVLSYRDHAKGTLVFEHNGVACIKTIELSPVIEFDSKGEEGTRGLAIRLLHETAHYCFLFNSVKSEVAVSPNFVFQVL